MGSCGKRHPLASSRSSPIFVDIKHGQQAHRNPHLLIFPTNSLNGALYVLPTSQLNPAQRSELKTVISDLVSCSRTLTRPATRGAMPLLLHLQNRQTGVFTPLAQASSALGAMSTSVRKERLSCPPW